MHQLSAKDLTCPLCGGNLLYERLESSEDTRCLNCGYKEPSGSAEIVRYTSTALAKYTTLSGIHDVDLGRAQLVSPAKAMLSRVCLPIMVSRSNSYTLGRELLLQTLGTQNNFRVVPDRDAYFGSRVVYQNTQHAGVDDIIYDVSRQLISMSFVIDETRMQTASRLGVKLEKVRTLCLSDVLYFAPEMQQDASKTKLEQAASSSASPEQGA